MGMTNKQFQGFIRLIINAVETATQHIEPSNEKAREAFDNAYRLLYAENRSSHPSGRIPRAPSYNTQRIY